jgi:hypothetical protein
MSFDEVPLVLFNQLKKAGHEPTFTRKKGVLTMLLVAELPRNSVKSVKNLKSPVALAVARSSNQTPNATRKQSQNPAPNHPPLDSLHPSTSKAVIGWAISIFPYRADSDVSFRYIKLLEFVVAIDIYLKIGGDRRPRGGVLRDCPESAFLINAPSLIYLTHLTNTNFS